MSYAQTLGYGAGGLLGSGAGLLGQVLEPLDYPRQAIYNLGRSAYRGLKGEGSFEDVLAALPGLLGAGVAGGLMATGVGAPLGILAGSAMGGLMQGAGQATAPEVFQASTPGDLTQALGVDPETVPGMAASFGLGMLTDPLTYAGGLGGARVGARAGKAAGKVASELGDVLGGAVPMGNMADDMAYEAVQGGAKKAAPALGLPGDFRLRSKQVLPPMTLEQVLETNRRLPGEHIPAGPAMTAADRAQASAHVAELADLARRHPPKSLPPMTMEPNRLGPIPTVPDEVNRLNQYAQLLERLPPGSPLRKSLDEYVASRSALHDVMAEQGMNAAELPPIWQKSSFANMPGGDLATQLLKASDDARGGVIDAFSRAYNAEAGDIGNMLGDLPRRYWERHQRMIPRIGGSPTNYDIDAIARFGAQPEQLEALRRHNAFFDRIGILEQLME